MKNLNTLCSVLFLLALPGASLRAEDALSCVAFAQGFYDWYLPQAKKQSADTAAMRQKPELFSQELLIVT
jgi:hypothetical protein